MVRHIRRLATGLIIVLVAVGLPVLAAPAASAATKCSGTVTWASSLKKQPRAQLVIYYNSSNGGTNSACMYHAGSTYGKALRTQVQISRCGAGWDESDTYCTTDRTSRTDSGRFSYYAGPVGVTGTKVRCVVAWGTIITSTGALIRIDSGPQGC